MSKKHELRLSNLSPLAARTVIPEIREILNDDTTDVFNIETRGAFHDAVNIVFSDFHPATFILEYLATKVLLDTFYDKVKPAVLYLLSKRIPVKSVCLEKDLVSDNQIPYTVYIVADADQIEDLIKQVDTIPQYLLAPSKPNCKVVIRYDNEGKLDVHTMGE